MRVEEGNPFRYGRVVRGENFCARPLLERELMRLIASGQSVVVQGERRMGKTSLVCEAVSRSHNVRMIYIDLFGVRTMADFCHRATAAVLALDRRKSFLNRIADLLKRLRPTVTIDVQTGAPSLSVDVANIPDVTTVETVMDMLGAQAKNGRTCVVFDEFQELLHLDGAPSVLGTMRGKIQFQSDLAYVFLGSVRNRMTELFASPRSPFYKSAALLDVGRIDDAPFVSFLKARFKAGKRKADEGVLLRVLDVADRVSGDVQELCDALWATTEDGASITSEDIPAALDLVFARESKSYPPLVSQLTAIQMRVLRGVAKWGGQRTLSMDFLRHVGVANAGSVRKSIMRLVTLDILYWIDGEYRFCNPFFKAWIVAR